MSLTPKEWDLMKAVIKLQKLENPGWSDEYYSGYGLGFIRGTRETCARAKEMLESGEIKVT